jgi:hypothetical protein
VVVVVFFFTYGTAGRSYRTCAADEKYQTTGSRRDTHHGYYKGLSSTGTSRMCIKALRERNL